jgi:hypothetical protein
MRFRHGFFHHFQLYHKESRWVLHNVLIELLIVTQLGQCPFLAGVHPESPIPGFLPSRLRVNLERAIPPFAKGGRGDLSEPIRNPPKSPF